MKHRLAARSILAGVILVSQLCSSSTGSHLAAGTRSSDHPSLAGVCATPDVAGNQAFIGDIHCPDIRITINFVNVTPSAPAQQHVVNLTWEASKPSCFTISGFKVSGIVTFENGQTRTIESAVPGNQFAAHIPFQGIPQTRPRQVTAKVGVTASAAITGSAIFPAPSPSLVGSGPCTITMQVTQAAISGLVPAPDRPGQDFHPKVKIQWQINSLPTCQRVSQFRVEGELIFKGKSNPFSQTVSGTQYSTEITLTSLAVDSAFTPESVKAKVTATGESKITGFAQKEARVN